VGNGEGLESTSPVPYFILKQSRGGTSFAQVNNRKQIYSSLRYINPVDYKKTGRKK
jgi:hypothetical protein